MDKQEVMTKICRNVVLSQIAEYESAALTSIIDQALAHPVGVTRWRMYERLKRQASTVVGWDATHVELATCGHYEALIGLIDELLPIAQEDDIPDYDDLVSARERRGGFSHISESIGPMMDDIARRYQQWLDSQAG